MSDSVEKNKGVKSLAAMKNTMEIRHQDIVVNPNMLFSRMECVMKSSCEMEQFLAYKLSPEPLVLLTEGQTRKTQKSALSSARKSLTKPEGSMAFK